MNTHTITYVLFTKTSFYVVNLCKNLAPRSKSAKFEPSSKVLLNTYFSSTYNLGCKFSKTFSETALLMFYTVNLCWKMAKMFYNVKHLKHQPSTYELNSNIIESVELVLSMRDNNEEDLTVVDDADNNQSFNVRLSVDMIDRGCEAIDTSSLILLFATRTSNWFSIITSNSLLFWLIIVFRLAMIVQKKLQSSP